MKAAAHPCAGDPETVLTLNTLQAAHGCFGGGIELRMVEIIFEKGQLVARGRVGVQCDEEWALIGQAAGAGASPARSLPFPASSTPSPGSPRLGRSGRDAETGRLQTTCAL